MCIVYPLAEVMVPPDALCDPKYRIITTPVPPLPEAPPPPPVFVVPFDGASPGVVVGLFRPIPPPPKPPA